MVGWVRPMVGVASFPFKIFLQRISITLIDIDVRCSCASFCGFDGTQYNRKQPYRFIVSIPGDIDRQSKFQQQLTFQSCFKWKCFLIGEIQLCDFSVVRKILNILRAEDVASATQLLICSVILSRP